MIDDEINMSDYVERDDESELLDYAGVVSELLDYAGVVSDLTVYLAQEKRAGAWWRVHTVLMLGYAIAGIFTWWWLFWPLATLHYGLAAFYQWTDPAIREERYRIEDLHRATLEDEARSHTVIDRMRQAEISRRVWGPLKKYSSVILQGLFLSGAIMLSRMFAPRRGAP